MLPSCRQVAEQLSENIDKPLTGMRWLKLKIHLLMCAYCRRYGKQMNLSANTIRLADKERCPNEALKEKLLQHYRECHDSEQTSNDKSKD